MSYQYRSLRIRKLGPNIDLGCGDNVPAGHVGIDFKEHKQDILWDVRHGIPVPDDSVSHLHSSHFIEHLTNDEASDLWVEILRVCRVGAVIDIRCPHSSSTEAYYHNHMSLWGDKRIRGVVAGFATEKMTRQTGKKFSLKKLEIVGIELITKLEVVKA